MARRLPKPLEFTHRAAHCTGLPTLLDDTPRLSILILMLEANTRTLPPTSRNATVEGMVNVSLLLKIHAILIGLTGIGFLIAPAALGSAYAGGVNATTELALRNTGVALLVVGIVSWFAGTAPPSALRLWIVRAFVLGAALGALLNVVGMSSGLMGATAWVNVVSELIFLVGFGYYGFVKTEAA